jgi:hypothetical protein
MWFDAGDRRSRRVAVTASQRRALSPSTLLVPGQDDTHVREERSEEHAARACSRHDEGGARMGATSPAGSCADPRHPRQLSARLKGAPSGRGARGRSGPRAMGRRGGCSDGASSRRHADRCLSLADRRTGPRPSPVCSCEPPSPRMRSLRQHGSHGRDSARVRSAACAYAPSRQVNSPSQRLTTSLPVERLTTSGSKWEPNEGEVTDPSLANSCGRRALSRAATSAD